jgi:hypothetical protein
MTIKQLLKKMTAEEKKLIEDHASGAASALAKLWDALRIIEVKYGVEFDGTVAAVETLAAECELPDNIIAVSAADFMETLDIEVQ